jgi:hypothetical protein
VYYDPQVEIVHVGGQSLAKNPAARRAYYQSLRYFYRKHYGAWAGSLMGALVRLHQAISGSITALALTQRP